MKQLVVCLTFISLSFSIFSAQAQESLSGATEKTPSRSEFFSWINNTNEGATEQQTLTNLAFFRYLKETYGMQLDIYAFDAGAIDGSKRYGSTKSDYFKSQFPRGFAPVGAMADSLGMRLGLWCGPDGFGDTPEEAAERSEMMISLVRDYHFGLFKMDAVCGQLRPEKYGDFLKMMSTIRTLSPDFILLNHRLDLGPGTKYSTTYLLGGAETYVDVHMKSNVTASHHRVGNLSRELSPTRLTEDHGVCLSSCLDYWDDDLILQAFNRNLILAPEIYGNPWFLRDDELPQFAFIFNLHRDYRDILVDGIILPEDKYGLNAMSRGDDATRMVTLRNLSWEPKCFTISLSEEIGLKEGADVQVRTYHPYIYDLGCHKYGSTVNVTVPPFRSCLVKVTTAPEKDRIAVSGIPYRIINDRVGSEYSVQLLGESGKTYKYKVRCGQKTKSGSVTFPGETLSESPYRHVVSLSPCKEIPSDIESIYWATVFAADNDALEERCIVRSGESAIPEVQAARDAFFNQRTYVERGISSRNLFDDDLNTFYNVAFRWGDYRIDAYSSFTLDFGEAVELDRLEIVTDTEHSLSPMRILEGTKAYVSADLVNWQEITFIDELVSKIDLSGAGAVRYLRFEPCPIRIAEVRGFKEGKSVCRDKWRASNLFEKYDGDVGAAERVWKGSFVLDEIPANSYLCVAVNGHHGEEGAWAGFKIEGEYVGCPDRSPSYMSNTWECPVRKSSDNYTYYLPLTSDMKGKKIEAFVMQMDRFSDAGELSPEIWMAAYPLPFESETITISK